MGKQYVQTERKLSIKQDHLINRYRCKERGHLISEICQDTACVWHLKNETFFNCTWVASDYGPFTLEEIGEMMDVSRERVRQIEAKALEKLERRGKRQALQDLIEKKTKIETSNKYLTEHEAAKILGVNPTALQNQRCKGKGVPYKKIKHRIWYNPRDINYYKEMKERKEV